MTASLATGASSGGDGKDAISGVENLDGSAFDDVLSGNDGFNELIGEAGNDTLSGAATTTG